MPPISRLGRNFLSLTRSRTVGRSSPMMTSHRTSAPAPHPAGGSFETVRGPVHGAAGVSGGSVAAGTSPAGLLLRERTAAPAHADPDVARLKSLMEGSRFSSSDSRIVDMFKAANPAKLNMLIASVNAHELIESVHDRLIGPDNREKFLKLLTVDRVADLSVASRAALITGLQVHDTPPDQERAIRNLFLATHGKSLTALKNAVDAGGDYHDLHELLHHDIDDSGTRTTILAHFKKEGAASTGQVKVLSDVDDTFYVNFKDHTYPKQTVYPGVKQFYAELDRGPGAHADRAGDLAFLTARPGDRTGVVEDATHKMLKSHGVKQATVLAGDIGHLIGNSAIADKKFENFQQYRQLYPEYGSVLVGDSGQGDVMLGQRVLATKDPGVRAVFIHDVTGTPESERAKYRHQGVTFFDTYVGAAAEAYKKGLMTKAGLHRIVTAAKAEFAAIKFDSPEQKKARSAELERDVAAAMALD